MEFLHLLDNENCWCFLVGVIKGKKDQGDRSWEDKGEVSQIQEKETKLLQ